MPTEDITKKGRRLLPGESVIEEVGRQMSEDGVTKEEWRLLPSTAEVLEALYAVAARSMLIPPLTASMALNILLSVHCLLRELRLCSNTGGVDSDRGFNLLRLRGIVI